MDIGVAKRDRAVIRDRAEERPANLIIAAIEIDFRGRSVDDINRLRRLGAHRNAVVDANRRVSGHASGTGNIHVDRSVPADTAAGIVNVDKQRIRAKTDGRHTDGGVAADNSAAVPIPTIKICDLKCRIGLAAEGSENVQNDGGVSDNAATVMISYLGKDLAVTAGKTPRNNIDRGVSTNRSRRAAGVICISDKEHCVALRSNIARNAKGDSSVPADHATAVKDVGLDESIAGKAAPARNNRCIQINSSRSDEGASRRVVSCVLQVKKEAGVGMETSQSGKRNHSRTADVAARVRAQKFGKKSADRHAACLNVNRRIARDCSAAGTIIATGDANVRVALSGQLAA